MIEKVKKEPTGTKGDKGYVAIWSQGALYFTDWSYIKDSFLDSESVTYEPHPLANQTRQSWAVSYLNTSNISKYY